MCLEKLGRMQIKHLSTFLFLHASNKEKPNLLLPSQQRLYKLPFLKKLGCQTPCWDQARLSSLVNKQADCTLHTLHCTLHTVYITLDIAHCTVHTAHCTLHTSHCTLHLRCVARNSLGDSDGSITLYGALQCSAVRSAVQCSAVQCSAV